MKVREFYFCFIFLFLLSSAGWCSISVSVSRIYYQTSTLHDSFEMKIVNHGDEPIRISFFTNFLTNKTTVKYIHFVRGNTFFLNIGESLSVPVEFSFSQSTKKLESNFPIICEITSLKRMNSSFEPKFRLFFYVSKIDSQNPCVASDEDDNSLF